MNMPILKPPLSQTTLFAVLVAFGCILLLSGKGVSAADIWVETPVTSATINSAIASAQPGDCVIMPNEEYNGLGGITIPETIDGEKNNPIIFRAETPGGVIFKGNNRAYLTVEGDYWIIKDFIFDSIDNGEYSARVISASKGRGIRITNNKFSNFNPDIYANSWVIYACENGNAPEIRIDHNHFQKINGMSIQLHASCRGGLVDHNYFRNFSGTFITSLGNLRGSTGIQVGSGGDHEHNTNITFEYNLFEDDELDAIHPKTSSNTIRYNVFRNCQPITIRNGMNNIIDSNYIDLKDRNGIRIHDANNKIINNFILGGNGWYTIMASNGGINYRQVINLSVINNTIINPKNIGIKIGRDGISIPLPPKDLFFKDNIIIQTEGVMVDNFAYDGNFVWNNNLFYNNGSATYWRDTGGGPEPSTGITHLTQSPSINIPQPPVTKNDVGPTWLMIPLSSDINNDGTTDILDIQACVNVILGVETNPEVIQKAKEVTEPRDECNVLDMQAIVNIILA